MNNIFPKSQKGRAVQKYQYKYTRVKQHQRKGRNVNAHDRKIMAIITPKERKIFDFMTTHPALNKTEWAGEMDFEKGKKTNAYLEKFDTTIGGDTDVFFDSSPDNEVNFHTHPHGDVLIFSDNDIDSILADKNQQAEILFHKGKSLSLTKPNKLNNKKFAKDYRKTLNQLVIDKSSDQKIVNTLSSKLKKSGFKLKKFDKGKEIKIPLNRVV